MKIVAHNCALSSLAEVLRESALSTSITHPNVVRALRLIIRSPTLETPYQQPTTHGLIIICNALKCITDCTCRGGLDYLRWLF